MFSRFSFPARILAAGLTGLALAGLARDAAAQSGPPASRVLRAQDLAALRQSLAVARLELQDLSLPDSAGLPFSVDVRLDGAPMRLRLLPHSMRSPDFQLLVQVEGGQIVRQEPAPPQTYRGWVEGVPGSVVSASLSGGQLTALVRLGPAQPVFGVQPARVAVPSAPLRTHAVYSSDDRLALDTSCATDTSGPWTAQPPLPEGPGDAAGDKICEIACDADVEFYVKNGSSVSATQADIENVLNNVEAIYQGDVGIVYTTTAIIVRTVEADPYSSTSSSGLLDQFQDSWNATQGGVTRDIAHLFTGKNLDGSTIGIAYISVICNLSSGYGVSESLFSSSMLMRASLTAHEIGHNWSAQHCNGNSDCSIMCSSIGGCSGTLNHFGQSEKNQILSMKNSSSCLATDTGGGGGNTPAISSMNPGAVTAFQPANVTVNGSNLSNTTKVTVGGVDVGPGNGLLSISSTQVTFKPPTQTAAGAKSVTVTTPVGTSNALSLTYTVAPTEPTLNAAIIAHINQPYTWTWAGDPNDSAWLVVSGSPATMPFKSYTLLSNYIVVWVGKLNGAGTGSFSLGIPAAANGHDFWSQLWTLSPFVPSTIKHTSVIF